MMTSPRDYCGKNFIISRFLVITFCLLSLRREMIKPYYFQFCWLEMLIYHLVLYVGSEEGACGEEAG